MPSSHLILCCPPSPPAPNAILRQFKEKYVYMYVCIYVCKYVQFVAQSCPTLCNFIDYCTPGFPVHHQLLELAHILESVMPSNHLVLCCPFSSCLQPFQASGSFLVSQFSALAGQSIGVSTSASVLPVTIQNWFPLAWTSWISLQSKGLSRVFSNTTVQKHQFFGSQLSL